MSATAHVDHKQTPGRLVKEAAGGFHELADGTNKTATGNTGWLDKGFIHEAVLHAELGTCTGTSTSMVLKLEQADDSSGNGAEELCVLPTADQDDDNTEVAREVCIDKRYVRLTWTIAGTSPVFPLTATLRQSKFQRNFGAYNVWA